MEWPAIENREGALSSTLWAMSPIEEKPVKSGMTTSCSTASAACWCVQTLASQSRPGRR